MSERSADQRLRKRKGFAAGAAPLIAAGAAWSLLPAALGKACVNSVWRASLPERFGGGGWVQAGAHGPSIWIHGAFEISAIVIAGAAGLTVGNGLLFPKSYTRVQSLVFSAKRGLVIMLSLKTNR